MSSSDDSAGRDPRNLTAQEFRARIHAAKEDERRRAAAMTPEEKLEALSRMQELARAFAAAHVGTRGTGKH